MPLPYVFEVGAPPTPVVKENEKKKKSVLELHNPTPGPRRCNTMAFKSNSIAGRIGNSQPAGGVQMVVCLSIWPCDKLKICPPHPTPPSTATPVTLNAGRAVTENGRVDYFFPSSL